MLERARSAVRPMAVEHVRGRDGAAGAGRAGGDGEAAQIEGDDHGLAIDAIEVDIAGVGRAIPARAVDAGAGDAFEHAVFQPVAQQAKRSVSSAPSVRPASSAAAPKAAMPGTFSVPGRRSRSWWPPKAMGARLRSLADVERADALGRIELVAAHAVEIDAERAPRPRGSCRAPARHRRGTATPASRAMRAISAMGWTVPSSLLACMMETSTVSGRSARRTSSGLTMPPATHGQAGHCHAFALQLRRERARRDARWRW